MQQQIAFVTGGSGFIGSEVIRQLCASGLRVRALMRKTSPRGNLEGLVEGKDYDVVVGDLGNLESLKTGVRGVDYVFHIAGAISAANREEFMRHNAVGTANLARACAEVNPSLKRFLYVSSLAASGPSQSIAPRRETDKEAPISAYGESKLEGERELFKIANGIYPVTVIRPPAVYGPRDRGIFEFFKFISKGLMPIFPASNETGQKHYSLIHVEDLVRAIVHCGLAGGQGGREVFFVAGDGIHSWEEIMREIAAALGKKPLRLYLPGFVVVSLAGLYTFLTKITGKEFPLTLDKLNELRPDFWICSNDLAKQKIGFSARYDLKKGVAHTAKWYVESGWL